VNDKDEVKVDARQDEEDPERHHLEHASRRLNDRVSAEGLLALKDGQGEPPEGKPQRAARAELNGESVGRVAKKGRDGLGGGEPSGDGDRAVDEELQLEDRAVGGLASPGRPAAPDLAAIRTMVTSRPWPVISAAIAVTASEMARRP
jgi:hypothetical protein